jgi:hypothetical protein
MLDSSTELTRKIRERISFELGGSAKPRGAVCSFEPMTRTSPACDWSVSTPTTVDSPSWRSRRTCGDEQPMRVGCHQRGWRFRSNRRFRRHPEHAVASRISHLPVGVSAVSEHSPMGPHWPRASAHTHIFTLGSDRLTHGQTRQVDQTGTSPVGRSAVHCRIHRRLVERKRWRLQAAGPDVA